jgi:Cytochrome P450
MIALSAPTPLVSCWISSCASAALDTLCVAPTFSAISRLFASGKFSEIVTSDTANSDPRMFDAPDELDLHRKARNHMSFGFGTHQCLGAPLARLELQVAYPALLRRFRDLAMAVKAEELRFRGDMLIYQVRELPVTW